MRDCDEVLKSALQFAQRNPSRLRSSVIRRVAAELVGCALFVTLSRYKVCR